MDLTHIAISTLMSLSTSAPSLVDQATGVYTFSPSISQEQACTKAENIAKALILQKTLGQKVHADVKTECVENDADLKCNIDSSTTHYTNGTISRIITKKTLVEDWQCKVFLRAEVEPNTNHIDPSFNLNIKLNNRRYISGEKLDFSFTPTKESHVYVFHFDKKMDTVRKVYPTPKTPNSFFHSNEKISSSFLDINYKLFSEDLEETQYLFFVLYERNVSFMDEYPLNYFHKKYDSLDLKKQLYKKPLVVLRR